MAASAATSARPEYSVSGLARVENGRPLVWVSRCSTVIRLASGPEKDGRIWWTGVSRRSRPSSISIWIAVPISGLVIERTQ